MVQNTQGSSRSGAGCKSSKQENMHSLVVSMFEVRFTKGVLLFVMVGGDEDYLSG